MHRIAWAVRKWGKCRINARMNRYTLLSFGCIQWQMLQPGGFHGYVSPVMSCREIQALFRVGEMQAGAVIKAEGGKQWRKSSLIPLWLMQPFLYISTKYFLSRHSIIFHLCCCYPFQGWTQAAACPVQGFYWCLLTLMCVHQWNSTIPPVDSDGAFFVDLIQRYKGFLVCWLKDVIMYNKLPFLPPAPSLASMLEKIVMAGVKGYTPISNQE